LSPHANFGTTDIPPESMIILNWLNRTVLCMCRLLTQFHRRSPRFSWDWGFEICACTSAFPRH
jgi:hypothetical protein